MITRFDTAALDRIRARLAGLAVRTAGEDDMPRAAVLVPLCIRDGAAAVLFTKRTETVGTHKGQVSFPGGRMDPEDADEIACALRELDEELGVPPASVAVLGRFHEVISITRMRVTPVIGFLGDRADPEKLRPSPAEIDDVFALTLEELLAARDVRPLRSGRPGPWYTAGPHPVWGLTAFILDEVLRDVLELPVPPL